jgi:DNA-binding CsgD family transcriptional regulator
MNNTSLFFNDNILYSQIPDYTLLDHRFQNLQSVSTYLKKTFFITDLYKKQLIFFNSDPKLSSIFGETTYELFVDEKNIVLRISPEFEETFAHYIHLITAHITDHTKGNEENAFYFSFKAPFSTKDHQTQIIEIKAFPYSYIHLSQEKLPWINFYQCNLCNSSSSGKLALHNLHQENEILYLLNPQSRCNPNHITLKQCDLDIFLLACQGFSETEIANKLDISTSSLKRIKAAIMIHINTQSTAQTVAILHQQGLI